MFNTTTRVTPFLVIEGHHHISVRSFMNSPQTGWGIIYHAAAKFTLFLVLEMHHTCLSAVIRFSHGRHPHLLLTGGFRPSPIDRFTFLQRPLTKCLYQSPAGRLASCQCWLFTLSFQWFREVPLRLGWQLWILAAMTNPTAFGSLEGRSFVSYWHHRVLVQASSETKLFGRNISFAFSVAQRDPVINQWWSLVFTQFGIG